MDDDYDRKIAAARALLDWWEVETDNTDSDVLWTVEDHGYVWTGYEWILEEAE